MYEIRNHKQSTNLCLSDTKNTQFNSFHFHRSKRILQSVAHLFLTTDEWEKIIRKWKVQWTEYEKAMWITFVALYLLDPNGQIPMRWYLFRPVSNSNMAVFYRYQHSMTILTSNPNAIIPMIWTGHRVKNEGANVCVYCIDSVCVCVRARVCVYGWVNYKIIDKWK